MHTIHIDTIAARQTIPADGTQAATCLVGETVTLSSTPALERLTLDDQPGGEVASYSLTEIRCAEVGAHQWVAYFEDGTVGALKLIAREGV